jgi:hypothetical protein
MLVAGTFLNLYLLYRLNILHGSVPTEMLLPAQIFCAVNGFRCLFPNRYNGNVVLHDTLLSSIFLTRTLATVAEIAWISQLAWYVLEMMSHNNSTLILLGPIGVTLMHIAAWSMIILCVIAQLCVWLSLLLETVGLMWYEEACWAGIFVLNTALNVILLVCGAASFDTSGSRGHGVMISLVYALPYLTFQLAFHLPDLARSGDRTVFSMLTSSQLKKGTKKAMYVRNQSSQKSSWGGDVGIVWMTAYWVLLPLWPVYIAEQYQYVNVHSTMW